VTVLLQTARRKSLDGPISHLAKSIVLQDQAQGGTVLSRITACLARIVEVTSRCGARYATVQEATGGMPNLDRSVVQALPVFSAMGEAELDNAIAHARAQRIPKGAAVFRQGERAESFFVLLHGRLKVVKVTPHGQQMIIRFVKATSMVSPKRSAARTIGLLRAQS
jgi:hypothetical protein